MFNFDMQANVINAFINEIYTWKVYIGIWKAFMMHSNMFLLPHILCKEENDIGSHHCSRFPSLDNSKMCCTI